MPFTRPSLAELVTRIGGDLRGGLEVAGPILRRAMADVLSAVWAGATHTLYGYLDWLARQLFATTAEREAVLEEAGMYGITPTAATYAAGDVIATGTDGSSILAETIIRLDAVTAYRVVTGQVIASGVATLPVEALLAGAAANLPEDATLTFENPILGVDPTVTVTGSDGIDGGVEEEGTEEVRARLLLRKREPPEGGADQDYEGWALEVPGVTRAWVYPVELGPGTVVVRFVIDGRPDIFPDGGEVADVQAKLEAERPITAEVTAAAPTELTVAFTIELDPDNADTRAAVEAELRDLFRRDGEPGDGVARGTIKLSKIRTAIGIAEDVEDYTLTVPAADVVPAVGELATVGVITWV